MTKPECGDGTACGACAEHDPCELFNSNPKKAQVLRKTERHIGWWCSVRKRWIHPHGKTWLKHLEVAEYLKQWNKTIDDIPEVEF